ncbi:MAG: hypothetical protein JW782_01735 [Candidatus Saganbacteria bacterium]|nr:hypothetical protein [Candidatus Saganbacteria bacterium]
MKKQQLILVILLIAALGYSGYVYWPYVSAYFPQGSTQKTKQPPPPAGIEPAKPIGQETSEAEVKPADQPKAAVQPDGKEPQKAGTNEIVAEPKLVDPFALRINVRRRGEVTAKPEEKEPKRAPVEPELEGIWVDSGMRVAFISGQALIEGGVVLGWRVSRITKTQVTLVKGGQTKILKLEEQ